MAKGRTCQFSTYVQHIPISKHVEIGAKYAKQFFLSEFKRRNYFFKDIQLKLVEYTFSIKPEVPAELQLKVMEI